MANGYMGKVLWVDLSAGTVREEPLDEQIARDYVGGYGYGARVLYDKMRAGVDPLGPENILGFLTGPLTGSPSIEGNRSVFVCKSPLTGGWGDANCGGTFGPAFKFAGFDMAFFTGASEKPVYLWIEEGTPSFGMPRICGGRTPTKPSTPSRHGTARALRSRSSGRAASASA